MEALILFLIPMLLSAISAGASVWMYLATKGMLRHRSPSAPAPRLVEAAPDPGRQIAAELRAIAAELARDPAPAPPHRRGDLATACRPRLPSSSPPVRLIHDPAPLPPPMSHPELELFRKFRAGPKTPDTDTTETTAAERSLDQTTPWN